MNLTAKVTVVSANARASNHVEVEQIIHLYRDGVEIGKVNDRYVINPEDDIKDRRDRVAMIAKAARGARDATETPLPVDVGQLR